MNFVIRGNGEKYCYTCLKEYFFNNLVEQYFDNFIYEECKAI